MKTKISIVGICIVMLLVGQVQRASAWGMIGHRVIAEIAENHLSKKAKKNIQKIIGDQKLAYWSNWADFIKSDPNPELNSTGVWHFVNTNSNLTYDQFVKELEASPENNLYKSYNRVKTAAKNSANDDLLQKQQQLYFILHLFGDAHQPMHVSRAADLGGNKIPVTFFGRKSNIHRVWDSDLVDNDNYSYTEYARVLDIHNAKENKKQLVPFEQALYESHQLANKIYDEVENNTDLSYRYIYDYKYLMEERLYKAGIRLAAELNEIYG